MKSATRPRNQAYPRGRSASHGIDLWPRLLVAIAPGATHEYRAAMAGRNANQTTGGSIRGAVRMSLCSKMGSPRISAIAWGMPTLRTRKPISAARDGATRTAALYEWRPVPRDPSPSGSCRSPCTPLTSRNSRHRCLDGLRVSGRCEGTTRFWQFRLLHRAGAGTVVLHCGFPRSPG